MFEVRKAQRQKAKLRIGLSGPSGSGKTMSALRLARGMVESWEEIYLIDTEQGSGELYSHLGNYNVVPFDAPYSPERYIEAIEAAEKAGANLIIIDSVTHEWDGKGGILESNELLAQTKFKGNSWAAWSKSTPRHQKFIEKIVTSKCHILTTARSKTDTIQVDGKVKKVGTKEIQREGFEYELTANFNIDRDGHYAIASKDRTSLFIDLDPFVINEETGKIFRDWAESGIEATAKTKESESPQKPAEAQKIAPKEDRKPSPKSKKIEPQDEVKGATIDSKSEEPHADDDGEPYFITHVINGEVDNWLEKIDALTDASQAKAIYDDLMKYKDNSNKKQLIDELTKKARSLAKKKIQPDEEPVQGPLN